MKHSLHLHLQSPPSPSLATLPLILSFLSIFSFTNTLCVHFVLSFATHLCDFPHLLLYGSQSPAALQTEARWTPPHPTQAPIPATPSPPCLCTGVTLSKWLFLLQFINSDSPGGPGKFHINFDQTDVSLPGPQAPLSTRENSSAQSQAETTRRKQCK